MRCPSRKVILAMTLLELVVSLSLAAGLLGSIFYWIWSQNKLTKELNLVREKIYSQQMIELELQDTLGRACLKPQVIENDYSSGFKLEAKELHFYFKSGVHAYSEMNLIQKAMLYLEGEALILKSSVCPEFCPEDAGALLEERRVLTSGIDDLQFYFLYLSPAVPKKTNRRDSNENEKPIMGLLQEALPTREDLPVATVVKLIKGDESLHFTFWREDAALVHQLERSSS